MPVKNLFKVNFKSLILSYIGSAREETIFICLKVAKCEQQQKLYCQLTFFHGDQSHYSLRYTGVVISVPVHNRLRVPCNTISILLRSCHYFSPRAMNHYTFSLYLFYQLSCRFDRVLIDCLEGIFMCNCRSSKFNDNFQVNVAGHV